MRGLLAAVMAAAGFAFFLFAGEASRPRSEPSVAAIALYFVAGACFLLASSLYRKRDGG